MNKQNQSAESFADRVRRTLEDLTIIRQSLLAGTEQTTGQTRGPSPLLDLELAAELKTMVDALRQLLWAYIQALSAKSGRQPHEILDWYKMELAVEMLRGVRNRAPAVPAPEIWTFDQLVNDVLAITSMHTPRDRHC